jgi:hypothetical protein
MTPPMTSSRSTASNDTNQGTKVAGHPVVLTQLIDEGGIGRWP